MICARGKLTESQSNTTNEVLRQALALASTNPSRALDLLQQALITSRRLGDREAIDVLSRNAGLICVNLGELRRGIAFYEDALAASPDDAYLHFAKGDAYRRLGELADAARAFARSAELAREKGDQDMVGMASNARAALNEDPG